MIELQRVMGRPAAIERRMAVELDEAAGRCGVGVSGWIDPRGRWTLRLAVARVPDVGDPYVRLLEGATRRSVQQLILGLQVAAVAHELTPRAEFRGDGEAP